MREIPFCFLIAQEIQFLHTTVRYQLSSDSKNTDFTLSQNTDFQLPLCPVINTSYSR